MFWASIPSLDTQPLGNMDLTKVDTMLVNYILHSSTCKAGVAFMYFHRELSVPCMNSNVIMYNQKMWVLIWHYISIQLESNFYASLSLIYLYIFFTSVFLFLIFRIHLQKKRGWWNSETNFCDLEANHQGMKTVISSGKCSCKSGNHTTALGLSELWVLVQGKYS